MNDFAIASNRSFLVELKHNKVTINQFQMHNFDEWSGYAQAIKKHLKNHPDDIPKLLDEKQDEVLNLVALSLGTTKNPTDVARIFAQEKNLSFGLIKAVIQANDAFFSEPIPKHRDDVDPRKKSSWFDVFQLLVSNGHSHSDIMQMTYGAFSYYLKSAQKLQRSQMRSQTNLMRAAQHANAKEFKKLTEELKSE